MPYNVGKTWHERQRKNAQGTRSVVSRDVWEDTAIGVGSNKNTRRAIHDKTRHKEIFVNGHIQLRKGKVTASPKVRVKAKAKRKHLGKGNHNQDQAGSQDEETGQRRLDDFGIQRQRVEFVGDVQEHNDDFETPRVDRAAYVFCDHKCKSVMTDWPEMPST